LKIFVFGVWLWAMGGERRTGYCSYCGARIDPSFRYCPYYGSSLPSVEMATDVMSGGVEGVNVRMYKQSTYVGKPLSSRAFGILSSGSSICFYLS